MKTHYLKYISLSVVLFVSMFGITHAQSAIVSLEAQPEAPEPFEDVTLQLNPAYGSAEVVWTLDGQIVQQGIGQNSLQIQVGALGTQTTVEARVRFQNGQQMSDSVTLTPADVDLIWESDAYTPPFYKGKTLSPINSEIRVVAIPHLLNSSGVRLSESQLVYTWEYNRSVQQNHSGYGENVFTLTTPPRRAIVGVRVTDPSGSVAAEENIVINAHKPLVHVYRDYPLLGVWEARALEGSITIPSQEETFVAYPYHFSTTKSLASATFNWKVNGRTLEKENNVLTIEREGTQAQAQITLGVSNTLDALQQAITDFAIQLIPEQS